MKRLIKWIGIALVACVVVGIIGAIFGGGNKDSGTTSAPATSQAQEAQQGRLTGETTSAEQPAQTPKPTNTSKPQPSPTPLPAIGSDVMVGKIRWKVTAASVLGQVLKSNNQFIDDKTTSGKFVEVSYQIENRDTDSTYFTAPRLVDAQKREFSDYSDALFFISDKEQCVLKELNPNVPAVCTVIYEVAADAEQLNAQVTSLSLLGGSPVLIDLGIKGQ